MCVRPSTTVRDRQMKKHEQTDGHSGAISNLLPQFTHSGCLRLLPGSGDLGLMDGERHEEESSVIRSAATNGTHTLPADVASRWRCGGGRATGRATGRTHEGTLACPLVRKAHRSYKASHRPKHGAAADLSLRWGVRGCGACNGRAQEASWIRPPSTRYRVGYSRRAKALTCSRSSGGCGRTARKFTGANATCGAQGGADAASLIRTKSA